jgi:hypothetical protein
MSALSIQSSVAAVIASDDDGGGQRYIRAVAMSGSCRSRVVVLPPSLPATTTAAVKGIFGGSNVGLLSIQVVVLPPSLVPPDSARSPAATGSENRRWLLFFFVQNGVSWYAAILYPEARVHHGGFWAGVFRAAVTGVTFVTAT